MLSDHSVKKPYTVVVAVVLIAILGAVSFTNMSTDLLPSLNLPYAVVLTTYIGGSPEEVELVVTSPVEQRMASISNVKNISSISSENFSVVIIEFNESANMDSVVIEMRESLDMIKAYLPDNVGNPIIMKLNPDMMPIMVVSAAVKGQDISESSAFLETKIVPELESIEGVASVSASGLVESQIHVLIREDKIKAIKEQLEKLISSAGSMQVPRIELDKDMISGILKGQNFSMPAGYITEEGIDYLVRTGDSIKDIEELRSLAILSFPIPGAKPVRLGDVADIVFLDNSGEMYSKVNGNDAIILTIQKQTEYSTADIAKKIREKTDVLMDKNEGVEIVALMDQGEYVDLVVNSLFRNLIFGGLLAILILLLFLRDIKPTIIIGFAIPVSIVTAFVMMYFGKITLNIISMGGLALGVGMLVDNSIVVIENIYRMRNEGKSPKEAAVQGAKQVSGAILASTLTTVAVFVPIVFTQGLTRQIFSDMGLTIAFSLLASLLIALTLVPMMASGMLIRNINKDHKYFEAMKKAYIKALRFSLRKKWIVIAVVVIMFAASIAGALRTGTELFPSADSGQLTVNIETPVGTSFNEKAEIADKVADILMDIDDVETVGASIGGGLFGMGGGAGFRGQSSGSVSYYVTLKSSRSFSTDKVAQLIRNRTQSDDYEVSVDDSGMDLSALSGGTIVIEIKGREFDVLEKIATDVAEIVSSVEGTVDVVDGIEETAPELRIVVDKDKSISKGLTVAQVFMQINSILSEDPSVTAISINNKEYEVFIKDNAKDEDLGHSDLLNLEISNPLGEMVPLGDIASIEEASGFSSINRTNQQRNVTINADLAEGYNVGLVSDEISSRLDGYEVPDGYSVEMGGETRMIGDSFNDLLLMLLLAVLFIYLIMVAQFQSLLSPFIVMFTIPLAFTGGFLGLMATGNPISIVAFVGLIVLAGVVVNNGIVFVDYVNKMREEGLSKFDALIKAGNDRMRPILMTALTTIFALSTLALGAGDGTEMMQPMAITAIGGLIYATLVTLVFVPVLYDAFHKNEK